jgi:2-hydroxychromene-2-carboxylate isomerase
LAQRRVDFYFDYLSGYAYFGWLRIQEICDARGVELVIRPVLFAGLLNHWGTVGPAEVEPRRAWVYRDGFRYAALRGIELDSPKYHPFNPLPALRTSLAVVSAAEQRTVVQALFLGGWAKGIDMGSPEELAATLNAAGVDGQALLERARSPEAKQALVDETNAAVARGVFGIPTVIVDDELFFGNDRMDYVEMYLDGRDPLDPYREKIREILARPRAVDRPGRGSNKG